jgi:hypothetical protein
MQGKTTIMAAIFWLLLYTVASAGESWQADIKVGVIDAENRLSIGQRPDATDGWNARYDVPAILSGDIMAYIEESEGGKYWRKFKGCCARRLCIRKWDVLVESDLKGQIIKLSWDPSSFPPAMTIFLMLMDEATGDVVNMQAQPEYSYKNTGKRKFQVETRY